MNCDVARLKVLGTKTLPTVSSFERAELVNTISGEDVKSVVLL